MEIDFLTSLLLATIAIVPGLISAIRSCFKNSSTLTRREIKQKQLDLLFEPLHGVVFEETAEATNGAFLKILNLAKDNLKLVPTNIYRCIVRMSKENKIGEADLAELSAEIEAYYNYLCKCLGYPYDRQKISSKQLRLAQMDYFLDSYGHWFFSGLCIITAINIWLTSNMDFKSATIYDAIVMSARHLTNATLFLILGIMYWITGTSQVE